MMLFWILSVVRKNNNAISKGTYKILADCLRKVDTAGVNASNVIVYEWRPWLQFA